VAGPGYPLAQSPTDNPGGRWNWVFGSAHVGVVNFVMCDGSVHSVSVNTSTTVLGYLACRNDGNAIPQ
jgi:prepilin-type processing-associated H-X9-DG protein